MIRVLCKLPQKITVALSGGVDSVAITDFLSRSREVECAFFHHGTADSERAFEFVEEFCKARSLTLHTQRLQESKPKDQSKEEFWRNQRYLFLDNLNTPVITGHNLNDCVETYLWSAMHGLPKIIPFQRNNVIRPFLTTPKDEFISWCTRHNVNWIEDQSNTDVAYTRNYIRHSLMPHALHVNPGLPKVVKKLVEKQIAQTT